MTAASTPGPVPREVAQPVSSSVREADVTGEPAPNRSWVRKALRPVSLVAGLGIAAFVVHQVGVDAVLGVLRAAGLWLPLVALLEVGFVTTDLLALRLLLGDRARSITRQRWVRSTVIAYASTILLPTGRAAGEASRAAVLSEDLGVAVAASTCARLQAVFLAGNGAISLLIAGVLLRGAPSRRRRWRLRCSATRRRVSSSDRDPRDPPRITGLGMDRRKAALALEALPATGKGRGSARHAAERVADRGRDGPLPRGSPGADGAVRGRHARRRWGFTVPAAMTAQAVQIVGAHRGRRLPRAGGRVRGELLRVRRHARPRLEPRTSAVDSGPRAHRGAGARGDVPRGRRPGGAPVEAGAFSYRRLRLPAPHHRRIAAKNSSRGPPPCSRRPRRTSRAPRRGRCRRSATRGPPPRARAGAQPRRPRRRGLSRRRHRNGRRRRMRGRARRPRIGGCRPRHA